MPRHAPLSESLPSASRTVRRGSATESLRTVNQRLARAERELNVQFIRIAQLQAQLDLVLGALRRSSDGAHVHQTEYGAFTRHRGWDTRNVDSLKEEQDRAVMDIKIEERVIGRVTVLDVAGRLTIDQAAQRLKDKINSLIAQQRTEVVLNLKNVPYIDSGGLGQLVASYGSIMKAGGALKLLNVGSRNHDLLSITRLVTLFETFDSEAEAVRSFETIAPPAASR